MIQLARLKFQQHIQSHSFMARQRSDTKYGFIQSKLGSESCHSLMRHFYLIQPTFLSSTTKHRNYRAHKGRRQNI